MLMDPSDISSRRGDSRTPSCVSGEVIIRGVTRAGRKFRPSDWAERLAGVFSTLAIDNRLGYSPYVQPVQIDGVKSVIVNKYLQEIDARAYDFVIGFGVDNDLVIEDWLSLPAAA